MCMCVGETVLTWGSRLQWWDWLFPPNASHINEVSYKKRVMIYYTDTNSMLTGDW